MINVGLIGSGNMAQDMAAAFKNHGGFFIQTICDLDEIKAQNLAAKFGSSIATDYQSLLKDPKLDLIYIATPPKTHAEIFIQSLLAHKHTLCEKPLCLSDDEALRMRDQARLSQTLGVISAINYPMAYIPALKAMKDLLPTVGKLRHVEIKLHFPIWPRPQLKFAKDDWINDQDSGGILREISCHFLFALLEILPFNPIKRVCALVNYQTSGCEIGASAMFEHADNLSTNLSLAANFSGAKEEIYLKIFGEKLTLGLENFQILKVTNAQEEFVHPCSVGIDAKAFMSSDPLVKTLGAAIAHQSHELVAIEKGYQVQMLLNAMINSGGKWATNS